jgi:hypothetical protein
MRSIKRGVLGGVHCFCVGEISTVAAGFALINSENIAAGQSRRIDGMDG